MSWKINAVEVCDAKNLDHRHDRFRENDSR